MTIPLVEPAPSHRGQLPSVPALAALLALGLLAYAVIPVLLGQRGLFAFEFLNFDDEFYFGPQNEVFREQGLWGALTGTIANVTLPVAHASLYLDYALAQLWPATAPAWPHLHSLLLHGLTAWFVARFVARLGVGSRVAWLVGAIFLVHPALCESAAWVSSRKDLLSGLFAVLCLNAVARFAAGETGPVRASGAAATWTALALLSKATAVVLPALAIVVAAIPRPARPRRFWIAIPIGAVAAALAWFHYSVAASEGTMLSVSAGDRLAGVPGAFGHYLATTVWPTDLDVLYPEIATLEAFRANLGLGLAALAVVVVAILALRRVRPLVAAGLALWLVALLPFNTAFPASVIAAADRYLYLAIPGAALAVVGIGPRIGPALGVAAVVALTGLCALRAPAFADSEVLWRASLARDEANSVAWFNLFVDRNRHEAPIEELRGYLERSVEAARYPEHRLQAERGLVTIAAIEGRYGFASDHAVEAAEAADRLPDSPVALAHRVQARLDAAYYARRSGALEAADAQLELAKQLAPTAPGVVAHEAALALSTARDGDETPSAADPRVQATLRRIDAAIAAAPTDYRVHLVRGQWAEALGELLSANGHYERAIACAPQNPDAYLSAAAMFLANGMYSEAEGVSRLGIAQGCRHPGLKHNLGIALFGQGRYDDARRWYESYLLSRPRDRAVRTALAAVIAAETMRDLHTLDPDQLERAAERIVENDPHNPKAALIEGLAKRLRRDMQAAIVLFEQALAGLPDDPDATRLLADSYRDRAWELMFDPERRHSAMNYFRKFVDLAPEGVPTDAAINALREQWKKHRDAGRSALASSDLDRAETELRRCYELLPDEHSIGFPLGLALFQRDDEHLEEALACFERAGRQARQAGGDAGLPVLYQLRTLIRLGRGDAADSVGERFLADAGTTSPDVEKRIRALLDR